MFPKWNPEGFWRTRKRHHTLACGGAGKCEREEHYPGAILVGRRRAKIMRHASAKAQAARGARRARAPLKLAGGKAVEP